MGVERTNAHREDLVHMRTFPYTWEGFSAHQENIVHT